MSREWRTYRWRAADGDFGEGELTERELMLMVVMVGCGLVGVGGRSGAREGGEGEMGTLLVDRAFGWVKDLAALAGRILTPRC